MECGKKNKAKLGLAGCILFRDLPDPPNMEDRAAIYTPGPDQKKCGETQQVGVVTTSPASQMVGKGAEERTLMFRE